MPRVMIGEIRESYEDDEKIDRRPHSLVWEGEGRGCGDEYGVGEMLSFVCFLFDSLLRGGNTGGLKEENKGGEERRKEGNPARWPLSKTGLLADTSRYGPQIQKKNGRTDPITEDQWRKPM
jgi:hypothetical protein